MVPNISNRPQQVSALTVRKEYEIGRPQSPFVVQPPQPVGVDEELIEETVGVFDKLLQDETGSDPGFVTISVSSAIATQLMAHEETTDVLGQMVYEETTGVFGNLIERGGV